MADQPALPPSPAASIHGVIVDRAGQVCEGAHVALLFAADAAPRTAISDSEGRYLFGDLPAGAFTLTVSSQGFATRSAAAVLTAGQSLEMAPVELAVTAEIEVQVNATRTEIAVAQFHLEERQRVLGVMPNFFVSYDPDAAPLTARQKFHLAWKNQTDPVTLSTIAIAASLEQAGNDYPAWGQGSAGFGRRYAAAYGSDLIGTMIGSALLPSLFHQDPRFFFRSEGSRTRRVLYALRSVAVCRGDNGHQQFNYSSLLGDFAAAGITRYFYPAADRHGFALTVQSIALDKATGAAQNVFQELFGRKLTSRGGTDGPSLP